MQAGRSGDVLSASGRDSHSPAKSASRRTDWIKRPQRRTERCRMRIAIERQEPVDVRPEVLEIVAPRANTAAIGAAENFFSGLTLRAPFCLEIAATHTARWF